MAGRRTCQVPPSFTTRATWYARAVLLSRRSWRMARSPGRSPAPKQATLMPTKAPNATRHAMRQFAVASRVARITVPSWSDRTRMPLPGVVPLGDALPRGGEGGGPGRVVSRQLHGHTESQERQAEGAHDGRSGGKIEDRRREHRGHAPRGAEGPSDDQPRPDVPAQQDPCERRHDQIREHEEDAGDADGAGDDDA